MLLQSHTQKQQQQKSLLLKCHQGTCLVQIQLSNINNKSLLIVFFQGEVRLESDGNWIQEFDRESIFCPSLFTKDVQEER